MKKKTTTLEEVREYFKNAKVVKCLADDQEFTIKLDTIHTHCVDIWVKSIEKVDIKLHDSTSSKYAEIVEYKNSGKRSPTTPNHYHSTSTNFDVIDLCQSYDLDFCSGNVVKYIVRAGKKEGESTIKDLLKAQDYLNRLIKNNKEK